MPPRWLRAAAGVPLVLAAVGLAAPGSSAAPAPAASDLRLNQIQVIGTHNSYHVEAPANEQAIRTAFDPAGNASLQYGEPALATQLGADHVRQLEIDVWADPHGGAFAHPILRALTLGGPWHPDVMSRPGFKVLHLPDIDYHSNCLTFASCLSQIRAWSDADPQHVPVAVLIELKDTSFTLSGVTVPAVVPWTPALLNQLDAQIRRSLGASRLITPDDVRGSAATLEQAVTSTGWPTLAASRGKLLFLLDAAGDHRADYLAGHPSLAGRVLFTPGVVGQPDAAFIEQNDPTGAQQATIQAEVRAGYLVRTRADVDTAQARAGDTSMRDAALASGAQYVSTDYPVPGLSARFGTDYSVQLPGGGAARCDPVDAPAGCTAPAAP